MLRIYGDSQSGNCYKIKLLLKILSIEHEWIHVDILAAETHTAEFKKMNPNSRIPVLVLNNGSILRESNAILNFLAEGSEFLPQNPYLRAQVLQWQFFEQYSHEPFIATARYNNKYLGLPEERRAEYEAKQEGGAQSPVCDGTTTQSIRLSGRPLTDYRRHQPLCLFPCGTRWRL